MVSAAVNQRKTHLLYLYDKNSKRKFLVDSGANLSVFPADKNDTQSEDDSSLVAANGTKINSYGEKLLNLNLGLRREFVWPFVIADVQYPILGADFLSYFNLSISMHDRTIIDNVTDITHKVESCECPFVSVSATSDGHHVEILSRYPSLTSETESLPPVKHNYEHKIPTNGKHVWVRPRKLNPKMYNIAKEAFKKMQAEGIVRPSNSPYVAPLHLVPKKKSWRPVGDYRALNKTTVRDTYPLPFLHDFSLSLHGTAVFSRLDLKDAFFQIPISKEDIPKTCVTTPFGAFEFTRMNFGLCGAAQSFQRFIDGILSDLKVPNPDGSTRNPLIFAYIDDILIASADIEQHKEDLDTLFKQLAEYGLKLNVRKCEFFKSSIDFLGHTLSKDGMSPMQEKVSAVRDFHLPKTFRQLRRFTGMINFYHRFIRNAAKILAPLNDLLAGYKKSTKYKEIEWSDASRAAFEDAKEALANATLLHFPDSNGELAIFTDASNLAVGGVLQQKQGNSWKPLSFFSRKLTKNERFLSTFSRELLAVYLSLKHFHHWLEGNEIYIYTDHRALIGALEKPLDRANLKEARQLSLISQYNPIMVHVSGSQNIVADALSRSCEDETINSLTVLTHVDRSRLITEQKKDSELQSLLDNRTKSSLNFQNVDDIFCDVSCGRIRPYVPQTLRRKFFAALHNLSHPGVKQSQKFLTERFIWPNMKKDIQNWVNTCVPCQTAKVTRHNKSSVVTIDNDVPKFSSVHLDLVGPLPASHGYAYLLTMMDRFSRWPEAVPIADMRAETVANAFLLNWVARYGIPDSITTDRGSQFESALFEKLLKTLGCKHARTTAYHPQSNGLIERFHRSLKSALRAAGANDWYTSLPMVLLGLRSTFKHELGCASSEVVYGCPLKLPIDLLGSPPNSGPLNPSSYADNLRILMRNTAPPITRHSREISQIDPKLATCPQVFVRNNAKTGLLPYYRGPYRVIERSEKFFVLDLNGKNDKVSIDRLKCANLEYSFENDDLDDISTDDLPVQWNLVVTQANSPPISDQMPSTSGTRNSTSTDPSKKDQLPSNSQPVRNDCPNGNLPAPSRLPRATRRKTNIPPVQPFKTRAGRLSKPPVRFS